MQRLARMSLRRRYRYCRFFNQSRRHALLHALFVPSHYLEARADLARHQDLYKVYK